MHHDDFKMAREFTNFSMNRDVASFRKSETEHGTIQFQMDDAYWTKKQRSMICPIGVVHFKYFWADWVFLIFRLLSCFSYSFPNSSYTLSVKSAAIFLMELFKWRNTYFWKNHTHLSFVVQTVGTVQNFVLSAFEECITVAVDLFVLITIKAVSWQQG